MHHPEFFKRKYRSILYIIMEYSEVHVLNQCISSLLNSCHLHHVVYVWSACEDNAAKQNSSNTFWYKIRNYFSHKSLEILGDFIPSHYERDKRFSHEIKLRDWFRSDKFCLFSPHLNAINDQIKVTEPSSTSHSFLLHEMEVANFSSSWSINSEPLTAKAKLPNLIAGCGDGFK